MKTMNKDSVARKVADAFLNVQKRFAAFMNRKTSGCSVGMLKVSFFLLCSVFLSLSVCFIVDAFIRKPGPGAIKVTHMKIVPLIQDKEESVKVMSAEAFVRLQRFRKYMDSIRVCDGMHYDSIVIARPGLMDSVSILENIYL